MYIFICTVIWFYVIYIDRSYIDTNGYKYMYNVMQHKKESYVSTL